MSTVDDFLLREYENCKPSFSIPDNPSSFPFWKESVRKELRNKLVIPDELVYSSVKLIKDEDCISYRRKLYSFSLSGLECPFYLLVPDKKPLGLVLALPGHGKGADDAIGLCGESYEKKFALKLCEEGFAVAVPENGRNASRMPVRKLKPTPVHLEKSRMK